MSLLGNLQEVGASKEPHPPRRIVQCVLFDDNVPFTAQRYQGPEARRRPASGSFRLSLHAMLNVNAATQLGPGICITA